MRPDMSGLSSFIEKSVGMKKFNANFVEFQLIY